MNRRSHNAGLQRHAPPADRRGAFTLIELLTVISIIAVIAAISLPVLRKRPNAISSANSILLADLALARQRAITYRTTVFMIFMPPVTLNSPSVFGNISEKDLEYMINGQYTRYALFARRSVGDQPGVDRPRYLTPWRALPEGVYIPPTKFLTNRTDTVRFATALEPNKILEVPPFEYTNNIPAPRSTNVFSLNPDGSGRKIYPRIPYIAFDDQGRLTSAVDAIIPLSRGFATPLREGGRLAWKPAKVREIPIGNTLSNYNHIRIDWLTGRARIEQMQIQ